MRVLQAAPSDLRAIPAAVERQAQAIAWTFEEGAAVAAEMAQSQGFECHGWISAARDPIAAAANPEWMHMPQHPEWLSRHPEFSGGHPALVAPYIGLNTVAAFQHAIARIDLLAAQNPWASTIWLTDVQGPPMGCGCGNPVCRSWDNAPGPKMSPTPYERPDRFFTVELLREIRKRCPGRTWIPVLCPECERGIEVGGIFDPDGPQGTNLCQGVACDSPCSDDYFPRLLEAMRQEGGAVGLLLLEEAFEKPGWSNRAHGHYGTDLIPCFEPAQLGEFGRGVIVTDSPQDCWPVPLPEGYVPVVEPCD